MDPPGRLGCGGIGAQLQGAPLTLSSLRMPWLPHLSSLGCMDPDTPKLIFWADLEVWLLVTSDLAWGPLTF